MAVDPRGADLKRFMSEDDGGPVVMLNLLRFAEEGRETYETYVSLFAEHFSHRFGAEIVYYGRASTVLAAEPGQEWDAVALVRYPDRAAFSRMVADPEYQAITHLRSEALIEAVLQATLPVDLEHNRHERTATETC